MKSMIFIKLSSLKYFKLNISDYRELFFNLAISNDEQYSPFKYLLVKHNLFLNELIHIILNLIILKNIFFSIKSLNCYLNKFILCYAENIDEDFQITPYHALINRFISSFWIKKN